MFLGICIFVFISCGQEKTNFVKETKKTDAYEVQFTQDSIYLSDGSFEFHSFSRQKLPKRIILLNTSLISYFETLGLDSLIVGVFEGERLKNNYLSVGENGVMDTEKIIKLKPDLIVYDGVRNNTVDILLKLFPMVVINNYDNGSPKFKLQLLNFISKFFVNPENDNSEFLKRDSLLNDLNYEKKNKTVFYLSCFNGMYFKSSCDSYLSHILSKAGYETICWSEINEKNIDFETAFKEVNEADFVLYVDWRDEIIETTYELKNIEPMLKEFSNVKWLYCNAKRSGLYETGELEPYVLIEELNQLDKLDEMNGKYFKSLKN